MLWKYISDNYSPGEPIVASDIDIGLSEVNKRRQFKLLTDSGKLIKEEPKDKLSNYIFSKSITKEKVDNYLSLFPDKIYKYIYEFELSDIFLK